MCDSNGKNIAKQSTADNERKRSSPELGVRLKMLTDEEKKQIANIVIRLRLLTLLTAGEIDIYRLKDRAYLAKQLTDNALYEKAPSRLFIETHASFAKSAKILLESNEEESAVILIYTSIEHILNFFVRAFGEMLDKEEAVISEMLRANSQLKVSVILPSLGLNISKEDMLKIKDIRSLRNKLVHFEHKPDMIGNEEDTISSFQKVRESLNLLDLKSYSDFPDKLYSDFYFQYSKANPHFEHMLIAAKELNAI